MPSSERSLGEAAASRPVNDVLLDIEGTTSSISFVHDVLFPYARARLPAFVEQLGDKPEVRSELERAKASLRAMGRPADDDEAVVAGLIRLIDEDVKDTALKALQGMIWREGFESGAYRAHVYADVPDALRRWVQSGLRLSIYSSGSVEAQQLFFGHTEAGDLLPLLFAHFDTTTGPKRDPKSYEAIARALGRPGRDMLFLSDVVAELDAAQQAGFRTCQLVRAGTEAGDRHPTAFDFDEVEAKLGLLPR